MNFDTFVGTVIGAMKNEWVVYSGPAHFELEEFATLRSNISISVALGKVENSDFREPWLDKFPDRIGILKNAIILWNGQPVFQTLVVVVDGARAVLPLPGAGSLDVPEQKFRFVSLLNNLFFAGDYLDYFERAKLKRTITVWPS